ncbi:MAG: hypothetical protein JAY99_10955 [Candidatus Thiodiazotropha lotti]|uniref:Uncharacterized protein n=1 Tax=Candidatus Thiodiazotropha endoloripes TaxID=1818881 RepID=A0A1E2UQG6_9GAMM|nr:hypothetical protein [Candidatus Thiodiazotropha endoloripes]MCG7898325.1 hypothetical protein [Candidatus Thiodiazotropha weberae]MCG7992596.1 hypothetical protein [Candidatus Thiodiazotropha lotti]MCG7900948.1 hypothetical protein [Candidatus Thiodiazotropha weberae]MCG7914233.1 hypothetical protein [Candidatus Thiodiazotropha weberae]MCG8000037.1 hypothetical protein [Candidatus Thiodiazotropha lotti]
MGENLSEIFFRPDELACERLTIPAPLYNQCRLMLSRCQYEHVFIPVRTLQIQAVLDDEEVIFIDNQAYAVKDGQGGKLIRLAWKFRRDLDRDNLTEPAPIDMIYYDEKARELHNRLIGEFKKAMDLLEERAKEHGCEPKVKRVLPFPKADS